VETVSGHVAHGFGSMTMGNEWAFPSKTLSYDTTLNAMKRLAERISKSLPITSNPAILWTSTLRSSPNTFARR